MTPRHHIIHCARPDCGIVLTHAQRRAGLRFCSSRCAWAAVALDDSDPNIDVLGREGGYTYYAKPDGYVYAVRQGHHTTYERRVNWEQSPAFRRIQHARHYPDTWAAIRHIDEPPRGEKI